jgi:hypothetical protein
MSYHIRKVRAEIIIDFQPQIDVEGLGTRFAKGGIASPTPRKEIGNKGKAGLV